jgi:RNA recognition motif-containing protein
MASAARSLQKLFVGNLPWTVGHKELRDFFTQFGHVISANVIYDKTTGSSRGYGFIIYKNSVDTETLKSLEQNNRLFLEGHYLNIQPTTE